ncbi:MAG: dimethylsulfonioproprionate lyase family protein [Pseudomonadales bacterium]
MNKANNRSNISLGLSSVAKLWLSQLTLRCPPEWRSLIPPLNLKKPNRILVPKSLPVLSYLPQMAKQAPKENQPLINCLIQNESKLHFNQTYSAEDFGENFLKQYGWIKFLGPDAYWHSDILSSGLVLFGDYVTYPEHWHVAEELYFPLSGTALWYHEEKGWATIAGCPLIHHASNIKHSMRTFGEPMLALYIWRGGNLVQKSNI